MKPLDPIYGAVEGLSRLMGSPWGKGRPKRVRLRHIVAATDGSSYADMAVAWAADLARRFKAKLHIVTSIGPRARYRFYGTGRSQLWAEERALANRILRRARTLARRRRAKVTTELLVGSPAPQIVRHARRIQADLVVVGSHGRSGVRRAILGSVADGVKHRARTSVLIAKTRPPARRILVAYDGSPLGRHASQLGLSVAREQKGDIRVLHVIPAPTLAPWEYMSQTFRKAVGNLLKDAMRHTPVAIDVRYGVEADHIVRSANESRSGLIVMGSRGLGWIERHVVGSVSNVVSHRARSSVLLLKEPPR